MLQWSEERELIWSSLLDPVSDERPCGPDLDEAGDSAFTSYLLTAESRLPGTSYVDVDGKVVFDRKIELASELAEIEALLSRTRDLRLLVLAAQFQACAQDLAGFAQTVEAICNLTVARWDDVHPQAYEGSLQLRRATLEGLDERSKVVQPLRYAAFAKDKQVGALTLRKWEVALKPESALPKDHVVAWPVFLASLGAPENQASARTCLTLYTRAANALKSLIDVFREKTDYQEVPSFGLLIDHFETFAARMADAFPDMATPVSDEVAVGEQAASPAGSEAPDGTRAGSPSPVDPPSGPVMSVAEAGGHLAAIEAYFATREPSSPCLLLVRQARMLLGRPMIEAIEMLAPSRVDSARIILEKGNQFVIDAPRMRALSARAEPLNGGFDAMEGMPELSSRGEAVAAIAAVERFMAAAEPASAVPMLLAKARELSAKDFVGLLRELFPANAGS
ncbi:MAG: type VI secretion system ImpA family N-terminal domain-containing protein [Rhizobiaceae bacterium]|nr:type VI secretion system ImpA family N-terminal domain-containing protein [Rhizobiaceae bacterium]